MLKNVGEVIEKAKELISQGQIDQAERELLLSLQEKKDTNEVYFLLGDIYLQKNSLREAEEAFKKAASLDSSDYLSCLNLGNICLFNEEPNRAEEYLSRVFENSGEYRDFAVPLLGDVYLKQEKFYKAYHYFEAALRINPEDEEVLYKAGLCLTEKGLVNPAKKYLKRSFKINPKNERVNCLLTSLEGKKDSIDKITIEESFIKYFKLLKEYYPETNSTDQNQLNETFAENYRKNLAIIKSRNPNIYEKLKNAPDKLDLQILPIIDGLFDIMVSKNNHWVWMYGYSHPMEFCNVITNDYKKNVPNDTPICLIGMAAGYELKSLFQLFSAPSIATWAKTPINVIEPSIDIFKANLMIHDLSNIFKSKNVFFFVGDKCLEEFFQHLTMHQTPLLAQGVILLDKTIEDKFEICIQKINDLRDGESSELKSLTNQLNAYYDQMTDQDWQKVYSPERKRPLRILGITSRFTTFLQYCMRDVLDSFKQLGCETQVLKETSDVDRAISLVYTRTLNRFKPDLIFIIDHNRAECPIFPGNIPYVNWVQDDMPNLFNPGAAKKIEKKDFVLSIAGNFKDRLIEHGYPEEKVMVQPIVTNTNIYRPIKLEKNIIEKYGCDVSFVHHGGKSPEQEFVSLLEDPTTEPTAKKLLETIYEMVSQRFLSGGYCYWNDYAGIVSKSEELTGYTLTTKARKHVIYQFKQIIGNRFMRQIPLEIIAGMGVDLKLYGRDWDTHPRLSKYACGIAENGEKLNKIFNASKIILHLQHEITTNPRVFDGMASGGFLLIQFLKYDIESVANYFEEDKDFIFFRNHGDLREKISYFLNHPEKREKIGQSAYRKIKEKYNYTRRMELLLEIIAKDPNNIRV